MTNKNLKKAEKTLYTKNFEKVVEVSLREFAITSSLDSKPILATYGIGPCVSFSGWSPRHKIGFMTHYDARTRMADSFGNLLSNLSEILQGESTQFKVRIIGGYAISESYNIISFLESRLGSRKDLAMTLVEKDIFGDRVESKSVALDTKTGRVYLYDPKLNPQKRELNQFHMEMLTMFDSSAKLIYKPGGIK